MFHSTQLPVLFTVSLLSLSLSAGPACSAASAEDETGSSTSGSSDTGSDGVADGACPANTKVGSFELTLEDTYSGLQGRVESALTPYRIADLVASEGSCAFYQPPSLFCDPPCANGETCDVDNTCVQTPIAVTAGVVSVEGLGDEVDMEASSPAFFYTYLGTLDHPPATEGTSLTLHATGGDGLESFTLDAYGITPLKVSAETVAMETDVPMTVTWQAGAEASTSINAFLNIAQHGGNPGWIECEFPDTGELEIPVSLTNQLLDQGFSGFPSLLLTRRSADSIETSLGCVQWVTQSTAALTVEIEGLTSCSSDEDCTPPETCQADLTCG